MNIIAYFGKVHKFWLRRCLVILFVPMRELGDGVCLV